MHMHTASKKKETTLWESNMAGKSTIRDDFPSSKPPVVIFPIFSPELIEFSMNFMVQVHLGPRQ